MSEQIISSVKIYTDGSSNPRLGIGSWAFLILVNETRIVESGLQSEVTHHKMELLAVMNSLNWLKAHGLVHQPIEIFVDSQYVCRLLERKERLTNREFKTLKNTVVKNSELICELFQLEESLTIKFTKLKSHQKDSIHYKNNTEVDRLCRKIMRERCKELDLD